MKARSFDARRLDVGAFAKSGASAQGAWPIGEMPRLLDCWHPDAKAGADAAVTWSASGEIRKPRAVEPEIWLHLSAATPMVMVCQRCLGPLRSVQRFRRAIRFVSGEERAAELDAEGEEDVLALSRALDLRSLVEDELLLGLPLVPRHKACPPDAPAHYEAVGDEAAPADAPPHPFAALAALKRGPTTPG
jgi:uncharacterized protein